MIECRAKNGKISLYTGYTNNLSRRFTEYAAGRGARFTKGKVLKLVFYRSSDAASRDVARARDQAIIQTKKEQPRSKSVY